MNLGTRGRLILVTGRLSAAGITYNIARANLQAAIDAIETYQNAPAADYTYRGQTFYSVIFGEFKLIPGSSGKSIHYTAAGNAAVNFSHLLLELF